MVCASNLKNHYKQFEDYIVHKGFANYAISDELLERGNRAYWIAELVHCAMNGEEMGFGLGEGDNGKDGREPVIFTCVDFQNNGEATQKLNLKFTLFCAMTYGDETLPFLLILPSSAETPKIAEQILISMLQIKGRFGHKSVNHFSPMIAVSPKDGMTSDTFEKYIKYIVFSLYPDEADELGLSNLYFMFRFILCSHYIVTLRI